MSQGTFSEKPEVSEGGTVGNVGNSLFESLEHIQEGDFPTNPTDPHSLGRAIYPQHSILGDWMDFTRQYAESADCYLIGSILPVVGALLARNVWYELDRPKYPNLFIMLTGKPGDRKTTAIKHAERAAECLLSEQQLSPSTVSLEGLTDQYDLASGGHPHKLLIADDANSILTNWAESNYGKIVAKKYLELYDCGKLEEAFRKNQKSGQQSLRRIDQTSTSILFGATFNICRFNKLEAKDGMARRFLYYVSEQTGRFIPNPPPFDHHAFMDLMLKFEDLKKYKGRMRLSENAEPVWLEFRKRIHDMQNGTAMTEANVAHLSALSEVPSLVIKVAMIFQLCQHVKNPLHNWDEIRESTLRLAIDHVMQSVTAAQSLDSIAGRTIIKEEADTMYANILCRFHERSEGDAILLSKTQITNAFAKNSGRSGAMKPNRIYSLLIPYLVKEGKCKEVIINGRKKYAFKVDCD